MIYFFSAKLVDQYEGVDIRYGVELLITGEISAPSKKIATERIEEDLEADGFGAAISVLKIERAKQITLYTMKSK